MVFDTKNSQNQTNQPLLERLHSSNAARSCIKLLRWLFALIFIIPGFEKASGHIFRRALSDPGLLPFFETLLATGLYWRFLGFAQILAGLLLLIPRTATLGALLCLPIYVNIVVLLISLPFYPVDIAAGFILLSLNVGLLLWDWKKIEPIFGQERAVKTSVLTAISVAVRNRIFRLVIAGLVAVWLVGHILNRLGVF